MRGLCMPILSTTRRSTIAIQHPSPVMCMMRFASSSSKQPQSNNNNNNEQQSKTSSTDASYQMQPSLFEPFLYDEEAEEEKQRGFWKNELNKRKFFESAAKQLGVNHLDDWYKVSRAQVCKLRGGTSILNTQYGGSLVRALSDIYPHHTWLPWRFRTAPSKFWNDPANHRKFFDWAMVELGLGSDLDRWYSVSREDFFRIGGRGFISRHYDGSIANAVMRVYPEHNWLPWMFEVVPHGFWADIANQRQFFDWAGAQLGILRNGNLDDWYGVSLDMLRGVAKSSIGLLNTRYSGSLSKALAAVYPEHEWLPWRFDPAPRGYWSNRENHRRFFEWAGNQLGINNNNNNEGGDNNNRDNTSTSTSTLDLDRWYNISVDQVHNLGGGGLLQRYYEGSLSKALTAVYPEHPWLPWRFRYFTPTNANNNNGTTDVESGADDVQLLRQYIDFLSKELRIERMDEWYRVSFDRIRKLGGFSIIEQHGGLFTVLSRLFPEHAWDKSRLTSRGKKAVQRWLRLAAQELFPNDEVFEEYHHPSLVFDDSSDPMTLDVWIPSQSLALEYQGVQHYHDRPMFGNPSSVRTRDEQKLQACRRAGITLVSVPYWWDQTTASLATMIKESITATAAIDDNSTNTERGNDDDE